jgi:acyl-CoA thioesterase
VTGRFSAATTVRRSGEGVYAAEVATGWDIAGNANGGYLLAVAARAMVDATGRPDPVTVTAHFLAPGRPGPADVTVDVVKEGRRFATSTAVMRAEGRPVISVLGTFGDLAGAEGPEQVGGAPPDLPDPGDCVALEATDTFPPPFMGQVELRLHPDDAGFRDGRPSGTPRVRGWFRLRDGEAADSVALLCAVDAFPPTAFNAHLPVAWTPTVELTAHVRARPAPGWLACSFATRFVTGGFLEADGEVWDATGRLVAQSRQLALVPRG